MGRRRMAMPDVTKAGVKLEVLTGILRKSRWEAMREV